MNTRDLLELADKLEATRSLTSGEYEALISSSDTEVFRVLREKADAVRQKIYGKEVYIRGLIECSSCCKNDCLYCGIRRSNKNAQRYRLSDAEIRACAAEGYELGFRTFVLQSGEDPYFTDERLCGIVSALKNSHPDCAVTLSFGERSRKSYQALFDAGADRYLLRHETASPELYQRLHPSSMSYENRMECLRTLRSIGYAVGAGFMVGAPFQTAADLALDLKFIEKFQPHMCGIGPFIPHRDTEFRNQHPGSADQTCVLLSVIRLIKPNILLPATTALGTIVPGGREMGIRSGANVVMPNLSPAAVRKKYSLYDNKLCTDEESAQGIQRLKESIEAAGYKIAVGRGDPRSID